MDGKTWRAVVVAAFLCVPLGLMLTAGSGAAAQEGEAPKEEPLAAGIYTGTLRAVRTHELRLSLKRYEGEILVGGLKAPGTWVGQGEPVGEFSLPDIERAVRQARSEVEQSEVAERAARFEAKVRREDREHRMDRLERDLKQARADMKYWEEVGRADELKRAEMNMQGHVDGIADQEDELKQLEELYKGNELASESQRIVLDRARRRLQRARENHEIAKHQNAFFLEHGMPRMEWDKRTALRNAEERMARAKEDEEIQMGQKEMAVVKADIATGNAAQRAEELMADASKGRVLFAPVSGVVIHGALKDNNGASPSFGEGDRVSRNTVLATILDIETLDLTVQVPIGQVKALRAAAESGKLMAGNDELDVFVPAKIDTVGQIASNGKLSVRLLVPNESHQLFHGLRASARISKD